MIKLAIILFLVLALVMLVRRGLIHVDLSFPWFLAIVILALLTTQDAFVGWVAARLGIVYAPIAIVFITIFILLGLVTALLAGLTRLRRRQIQIVRYLAALELERQDPPDPAIGSSP
jgi:hypothetical protein